MPLPYGEVGNCLKANRLGLGLDADEVANQRGMSRPSAEQIDDLPHVAGRKIDLIA